MSKKTSVKGKLDFIKNKDKDLKKTIEDSIQYINIIFEYAKDSDSDLYKEETYRVIVLYVISVIEAVLLYVLEARKENIKYIDYKYVNSIPQTFRHSELPDDPVVVAVQKEFVKKYIGLVELVNFMKDNGLMDDKFAQEILDINDIRNTFHFTKPRNQINCEIKTVERSLELLIDIIDKAPKAIAFKTKKALSK